MSVSIAMEKIILLFKCCSQKNIFIQGLQLKINVFPIKGCSGKSILLFKGCRKKIKFIWNLRLKKLYLYLKVVVKKIKVLLKGWSRGK